MYLLIIEDGSIFSKREVTKGDLQACDDGWLSILDISGEIPLDYFNGEWTEVEEHYD